MEKNDQFQVLMTMPFFEYDLVFKQMMVNILSYLSVGDILDNSHTMQLCWNKLSHLDNQKDWNLEHISLGYNHPEDNPNSH